MCVLNLQHFNRACNFYAIIYKNDTFWNSAHIHLAAYIQFTYTHLCGETPDALWTFHSYICHTCANKYMHACAVAICTTRGCLDSRLVLSHIHFVKLTLVSLNVAIYQCSVVFYLVFVINVCSPMFNVHCSYLCTKVCMNIMLCVRFFFIWMYNCTCTYTYNIYVQYHKNRFIEVRLI